MATIIRRGKSRFWTAVYRDFEGRQHWLSTKLRNKDAALRQALDLEDQARNAKLAEGQVRRALGRMYERIRGKSLGARSLRDYATQWLERKKVECTPGTLATYSSVIPRFVAFHGARADDDLSTFGPADVIAYRDHIARKLTAKTANNQRRIILALFGSAYAEGLLLDRIDGKRVPFIAKRDDGAQRRPFTVKEVGNLLERADGEWKGLILFGLFTGQRMGDIARLRWANVDLEKAELTFQTRKTSRRMHLPLAAPLRDYLLQAPSSDNPLDPIFPKACRIATTNLGVGRLSDEFHQLLVSAGLAQPRENVETGSGRGAPGRRRNMSDVSFHSLRHTATSLLKSAGVSEAVAMEFIGHDSETVSRHYTRIGVDILKDAADRLSKLIAKGAQK